MSLKDISKPIDKRLEPIKDLEFVISAEMEETLIEMLSIQQILDNNELSKRERKMLEKQKMKMFDEFREKLHTLNPTQIAIARTFISGKKNEER